MANEKNDWETSWKRMRLKSRGSELINFLFKVLYQLLPTQEKLFRINQANFAYFKAEGCPGDQIEDLTHTLILCPGNNGIGIKYLNAVKRHVPDITAERAFL